MPATWKKLAYKADVLPDLLSPYVVGDLLYASSTSALSKLADVAVGQVIVSGGIGVAPAWSSAPTLTTSLTVPTIIAPAASLVLKPTIDGTSAIQLCDKDGASILNVDTTNKRVSIGLRDINPSAVAFQLSNTASTELITNQVDRDFSGVGHWSGTNWAIVATKLKHTAGSFVSATLPNANLTAGSILAGRTYKLTYTISGMTAGYLTPYLGTSFGDSQSADGTYSDNIYALEDDADLKFLPYSEFDGSVDDISLTRVQDKIVVLNNGSIGVGATPIYKFQVDAPGVNQSAILISDGRGALDKTIVWGFGSLLTLNLRDDGWDYQLAYVNEELGKIANYQYTGNTLEFDHIDLADNWQCSNYLLGYGGFAAQTSEYDPFGLYGMSGVNKFALGGIDDYDLASGNPTPHLIFDLTTKNTLLGVGDLEYNGRRLLHAISSSDLTADGDMIVVGVDTNAEGFGAPLFMAADGKMDTADADASTTAPCVALALETGTGAAKKVLLRGVIRQNTWNWTIGPGRAGLIFLNVTVGTLMQTPDFAEFGTDDVIQVVGFALTADSMYFNPQYNYITKV